MKNLTSKKFSEQFKVVLDSLETAGYNNYWQVLNAKNYCIPQNRERVFIISIRKDIDTGTFKFPEGFPLELRLKDILEPEVDEKYYLNNVQIEKLHISAREYKEPRLVNQSKSDEINMLGMLDIKGSEQVRRVYGINGIAPTLNTMQGGNRQPKILVKEAAKKGYAEAYEGDSINLEQPNSNTRRGRVGKQIAQTITTSPQQVVAVAMRGRYSEDGNVNQNIEISDREIANAITTVQKDSMVAEIQAMTPKRTEYGKAVRKDYEAGRINESRHNMTELVPRDDGIANTLTTVCKDNYLYNPVTLRIRKLTPKECWRLMGFDDTDFEKAEAVNSNTQLYKQAGNSIVVNVLEAIFNKLFHDTKGEKMELKMQEVQFPKVIEFNFEELKNEITDKAELYKNMVYTDDTIKEAKADKATLNKFIKVLEDKRKDVKKECLQPYEEFEKQIKELVAIVDEPVKLIDSQVKEFEEKKKAEKLDKIKEFWETTTHPDWLTCKMIFDQKWLNATTSMKKIHEAITERLERVALDLNTLESLPEFAFEAVETYKNTLDVNKAIAEGQRLADIQKRKQEAEAAEAEKQQAAQPEPQPEAKAENTPAQPAVEPQTEAAASWIRFEACMTVDQAMKLKQFFDAERISFRAI